MKNYAYSPSVNMFYPYSLEEVYKESGTWPSDLTDVDDSVFIEFTGTPINGKERIAGKNGLPCWGDIPPNSKEQELIYATQLKSLLLSQARDVIEPMMDAQDGGYLDDGDLESLESWKRYRYAITKVDVANAPNIEWPQKPLNPA